MDYATASMNKDQKNTKSKFRRDCSWINYSKFMRKGNDDGNEFERITMHRFYSKTLKNSTFEIRLLMKNL